MQHRASGFRVGLCGMPRSGWSMGTCRAAHGELSIVAFGRCSSTLASRARCRGVSVVGCRCTEVMHEHGIVEHVHIMYVHEHGNADWVHGNTEWVHMELSTSVGKSSVFVTFCQVHCLWSYSIVGCKG